ncbi:hypothetical protein FS842_002781 [Serendipita sp. 407]|nr:hypothetical protein FS842_002781 [Serendipita sp. 407]
MTAYRRKSPRESEEGEEGSRKRKMPKKRDEDNISEDEMEDIIEGAGFTIRTDVIKEKWGLMRVIPLPKKLRRARTPEGKRVIVKFTQDDTGEVAILKYLKRHVGYLIVLPRCTPLHDILSVSYSPSSVRKVQTQFLEGIAFMHQHGVAHLDIKPDNIMVDPKYIPFKVSIIDFDVSMKVKDVETTTEGMVGTRGWIAPEVAKGGGIVRPWLTDGRVGKCYCISVSMRSSRWRWRSFVMG